MIEPTIGRVVWYWPISAGHESGHMDATITAVHGPRTVDLEVADPSGNYTAVAGVLLVQPGDEMPQGPCASWRPPGLDAARKALGQ